MGLGFILPVGSALHHDAEDDARDKETHGHEDSPGNFNLAIGGAAHSEDQRTCHSEAQPAHQEAPALDLFGLADLVVPINSMPST